MKKIIKKINDAIQVILLAPVKLPIKILTVIKYIGLGMGILESVVNDKEAKENTEDKSTGSDSEHAPDRLKQYHLEAGKEVIDETQ